MTVGYRRMQHSRTHVCQLQKLRELDDKFDIKDTKTLVSAFNHVTVSLGYHDEFLLWIGKYISLFEKGSNSECHHDAMEFVQLSNIIPKGSSEKRLVENVFNALCCKIRWGDYGESKLIEAFTYFLLCVDCKVFACNPYPLTKIARDVMKKLGPEQTFSRATYPTHSISLLALHHLCAVIHEVDPTEFNHDRREGLYQEMNRCLQNIIDTQSHYPFYYQATMTQQSLASMDCNAGVSSKEVRHRLFCGVKGTAYFGQVVVGAITMNFDLDSLEKGIVEWIKACNSRRIKQNSWYENVKLLIDSRLLIPSDPEKLEILKVCLAKIEEIQDKTKSKGKQRALRFAMIHEVTLLALDSQDESVREWVVNQLSYFGKCCAPKKGWAQDPVILETLVASVLNVQQKVQFRSHMEKVLATIRSHVGAEKLTELVEQLEHRGQMIEENKDTGTSNNTSGCESLFNRIKKDMLLDDSLPTRLATQSMLKKHYQRYSKVPSLFENEPSTHVNELDHSLLLYEKVFASNGQVQVEKTPIPLEDLFKNRQINRGRLIDKVKRVLLFGNPGTGKTSVAKKIAYKWSIGQWGDTFDMLYLIPIRELSSNNYDDSTTRKQRNLETAIINICFPGKCDETYEALRMQVEKELDKESTLVVFDGLDEGEEMTRAMIEATESKPCRVMVLSRPQNLHTERNLASVEVECMGLSDEQLVKFIESKCSLVELVEHLQRHPGVWEIAHTPVVANILTFLYKSRKEHFISEESSLNMCSLYWTMSQDIWDRYVQKTKSECQRDLIFEALEELAFRALMDGQILIDQHLVRDVCREWQTSDVLKDSGFLLLKRECVYYQFPHLSFQEFFAGQYMARSMMSKDKETKQEAIEFLSENKYCANFRQVFCFMIQALTLKRREEGYLQVEAIFNARPIALGYQQHLLLSMELLEVSLSASKTEDRERILDSTEVLDRAFDWFERRERYNDDVWLRAFCSERNSFLSEFYGMQINAAPEELTKLFVQVAKAARYDPEQWKKVKESMEKDVSQEDGSKLAPCIVPLMRAIPNKRDNVLEWYLSLFDCQNDTAACAALSQLSEIGRLMPNVAELVFERFKSLVCAVRCSLESLGHLVDYPRLAQNVPDRWQEILWIIKRGYLIDQDAFDQMPLNHIGRLAELVPQSRSTAMELIRELSSLNGRAKRRLARNGLRLLKSIPENATEIVEILWTLCEDGERDVYSVARGEVVQIMLSWGEMEDPPVDALLRLSEAEPESRRSSLVRLVAIAYKLIEETPEDVESLLSNLGEEDLMILWDKLACRIRDLVGTKTEKEKRLHWLHFMTVKALQLPEVEEQEIHMLIDNIDSDPINIRIKSAKFMGSAQSPCRPLASVALCKLALNCPEYEEDLVNSIDDLSQDEDELVAIEACVRMFSLLERLSHRAERIMNRLQESLHRFKCLGFLRMREHVSLDSLLKAYMECQNDFLIFWIVWQSFDTPITMEARRNGKTELILQTSLKDKKKYKFQTVEEAEAFASSFDECIEVVFPDVAPLVPRLDSQKRQGSNNPLFVNLRAILTSSS